MDLGQVVGAIRWRRLDTVTRVLQSIVSSWEIARTCLSMLKCGLSIGRLKG